MSANEQSEVDGCIKNFLIMVREEIKDNPSAANHFVANQFLSRLDAVIKDLEAKTPGEMAEDNAKLLRQCLQNDGLPYDIRFCSYQKSPTETGYAIMVKDFQASKGEYDHVLSYINDLFGSSDIEGLSIKQNQYGVRIEGPVESEAFAGVLEKTIAASTPKETNGIVPKDEKPSPKI